MASFFPRVPPVDVKSFGIRDDPFHVPWKIHWNRPWMWVLPAFESILSNEPLRWPIACSWHTSPSPSIRRLPSWLPFWNLLRKCDTVNGSGGVISRWRLPAVEEEMMTTIAATATIVTRKSETMHHHCPHPLPCPAGISSEISEEERDESLLLLA